MCLTLATSHSLRELGESECAVLCASRDANADRFSFDSRERELFCQSVEACRQMKSINNPQERREEVKKKKKIPPYASFSKNSRFAALTFLTAVGRTVENILPLSATVDCPFLPHCACVFFSMVSAGEGSFVPATRVYKWRVCATYVSLWVFSPGRVWNQAVQLAIL